jgi:hypothetical protein
MNDSFSGKNGKVKVMYVRSDDDGDNRNKDKRPSNNKGRPGDKARPGSRPFEGRNNERRGSDSRGGDSRGEARSQDARRGDTRPRRPARDENESSGSSSVVSAARASSIRSSCVASVRKRPVFTVRTPVRHCSRAVRTLSSVHGSCSQSPRVSAKRCAGWPRTARLTTS